MRIVDLCWAPYKLYHLPGNVISATVGFVDINLQPDCPNMSFLARLVSDNLEI